MPLKKQTFKDDEIVLFDEAILSKRGEYWQMRMWVATGFVDTPLSK